MIEEPSSDQRNQEGQGPRTNIETAEAPVLSGYFHAPVNITYSDKPEKPLIPRQIPLPPLDFTGRDEELQELLGVFERDSTIIGLRGLGGVGKTALAFALAERLKDHFPDGQLFVSMLGTSLKTLTPAEAMAQVIRSYQPTLRLPESEAERANLYRSLLDGKCALLLLDNTLDEGQVRPLLPPAKCCLMVTTRCKFKLPGMAVIDLEVLKRDKAVELLQSTAGTNSSGDQSQEKGTWEDLARLCGCLPVALRAAGSFLANTPDSSPEQYIKELQDERKRLGIIGKEGVEEDVVAKFSLSYNRLAPEIAQVFRLLSIFPGDFDAQAEETICQDEGHRHLSELVRWSLVEYQRSSQEGEGRYHLHDLMRLFAAGRLEEEGGEVAWNDAQQRHAEYFKNVLSSATELYQNGDALAGLRRFDLEKMNIESAWAWVKRNLESNNIVASLCNSFLNRPYLLELRMHPREWISWLEPALASARQLKDKNMEGVHLANLGVAYENLGETRKAIDYYELALAIVREIGDKRVEGNALGNLGDAYVTLGDTRKAIDYCEQALAIAREIGNRRGEGNVLGNLGDAYVTLGETRKAIDYYEQRLAIAREIGERRGEGYTLGNLGKAYADLGDAKKAIEYYEQALAIAREISDRRNEGVWLGNLGLAYANLGNDCRATECYEQALTMAREIGDRRGEGNTLWNMSLALDQHGRAQAIKYAKAALKIQEEIEDPGAEKVRRQLQEWESQHQYQ